MPPSDWTTGLLADLGGIILILLGVHAISELFIHFAEFLYTCALRIGLATIDFILYLLTLSLDVVAILPRGIGRFLWGRTLGILLANT